MSLIPFRFQQVCWMVNLSVGLIAEGETGQVISTNSNIELIYVHIQTKPHLLNMCQCSLEDPNIMVIMIILIITMSQILHL